MFVLLILNLGHRNIVCRFEKKFRKKRLCFAVFIFLDYCFQLPKIDHGCYGALKLKTLCTTSMKSNHYIVYFLRNVFRNNESDEIEFGLTAL